MFGSLAFGVPFAASSAITHNLTSGLQGGTTSEYYHLTAAEYTGEGTGVFVRKTSPTLVTPNIGVASGAEIALSKPNVAGDIDSIFTTSGTLNSNSAGSLDLIYNKMTGVMRPVSGINTNTAVMLHLERPEKLGSGDIDGDSAALFIPNQNKTGFLSPGVAYNIKSLETTPSCFVGGFLIGNSGAPVASSILELQSTTKGFLPPVQTTTQRNAISSPATGLHVFDSTLGLPIWYDGANWVNAAGATV